MVRTTIYFFVFERNYNMTKDQNITRPEINRRKYLEKLIVDLLYVECYNLFNESERVGERMRLHIANIITTSRILGSLSLLFCPVFSSCFYVIYIFCGFTDMVDGTIARKTHTADPFGAKLDTVADLIFTIVSVFKILPEINMEKWLWAWAAVIAVIKISNYARGMLFQTKLISLHTISNKITGFLLFLLPLTIHFVEVEYSVPVVCFMATFSAIQEGYFVGKGYEMI